MSYNKSSWLPPPSSFLVRYVVMRVRGGRSGHEVWTFAGRAAVVLRLIVLLRLFCAVASVSLLCILCIACCSIG